MDKPIYMKALLTTLAICLSIVANAQFGVTTVYNFNSDGTSDRINSILPPDIVGDIFEISDGPEVQLHYWFRLKNRRIEFQPTVYYGRARTGGPADLKYVEYGFQLEVNVYPFDFTGDCGCPTFGKQGPQLQKGLFLQFSPGVASRRIPLTEISAAYGQTTFVYGGGIGLDIGISNLLTLTPIATVRVGNSPYNNFDLTDIDAMEFDTGNSKLSSYQIGLQATFRLDDKNY